MLLLTRRHNSAGNDYERNKTSSFTFFPPLAPNAAIRLDSPWQRSITPPLCVCACVTIGSLVTSDNLCGNLWQTMQIQFRLTLGKVWLSNCGTDQIQPSRSLDADAKTMRSLSLISNLNKVAYDAAELKCGITARSGRVSRSSGSALFGGKI